MENQPSRNWKRNSIGGVVNTVLNLGSKLKCENDRLSSSHFKLGRSKEDKIYFGVEKGVSLLSLVPRKHFSKFL
jgi:hypothetical protein